MLAHLVERHDQVAKNTTDDLQVYARLKERGLRREMKLVNIILDILTGKNQAFVKRVDIELCVRVVLIRENEEVWQIYTINRQFQFLCNEHIQHTERDRVTLSCFQHDVDHGISR